MALSVLGEWLVGMAIRDASVRTCFTSLLLLMRTSADQSGSQVVISQPSLSLKKEVRDRSFETRYSYRRTQWLLGLFQGS